MKFLVVLSCLLAAAVASHVAPLAYSVAAPALVQPSGFSYSTLTAHPSYAYAAAPVAYSAHHIAAPVAYSAHHVAAPVAYSAHHVAPVAYSGHVAAPVAYSAPVVTAVAPAVHKSQYHAQDELGQAAYGHAEAFQTHNAVQDAAGNKVGSYSYVAPDGQVISASYVADGLGFRVASNALPVGPSELPVGPVDTVEVVAARAAHLAEHAAAKSRARRGVLHTPIAYSSHIVAPYAYSGAPIAVGPVARVGTLTQVVNTPGHAVSYRVD